MNCLWRTHFRGGLGLWIGSNRWVPLWSIVALGGWVSFCGVGRCSWCGKGENTLNADLDELMLVGCLCPKLVCSIFSTRPVLVANDEQCYACTGCHCCCGWIYFALKCSFLSSMVVRNGQCNCNRW